MSGALSTYRTPSRPVVTDMEIDNPEYEPDGEAPEKITIQVPVAHPTKTRLHRVPVLDDNDEPVLDRKGRPRYKSIVVPRQRQVLDYRPEPVQVSKHAAGRVKPSEAEQRQTRPRLRRAAQARMSAAVDARVVDGAE